jgi:large subunit ribosomal protein L7/L12
LNADQITLIRLLNLFILQEEEEVAPVKVQTEFTVKLMKFDETKKVALIKEIKALVEGMNLVQVPKFE